jgi:PAS domain S-box-containing protein
MIDENRPVIRRILSLGVSRPVSYGIAIAATAIVVVLQFALSSIWNSKIPAILFIPAIILSALVGGLRPGILTTALCSAFIAGYFWMTQAGISMLEDPAVVGELIAIAGIGWVLSVLIDAGRREMQRLAKSEEQIRVISYGVADAVIVTDEKGHVTQMNPVAEAITGWMLTEAKGWPAQKIYVTVENPVAEVLHQGIVRGPINHTVLTSKSGREIPIDENVAPIKTADGRASGVAIVFRDARMRSSTQSLRAEMPSGERKVRDDVEHAAARLRAFQAVTDGALTNLELAPLMRELLARVRTILDADSAAILLVDADGEHLIPTVSDGLREEVDANIRVPVQRGIAGRIAASTGGLLLDDIEETEIISPIPGGRVVSLAGAPIRLGEQLLGVIHAGSGVHGKFAEDDLHLLSFAAERIALAIERNRLQESSRAAHAAVATAVQQLQLVLNAGHMGIWHWTVGTGAVDWSPGLEAIHGFAKGSFPGTFDAVQKETYSDDRERVLGAITKALESGKEYHVEYRIIRADGAIRWVEGRGQMFYDSLGRPEEMAGVCSDITERRQIAEAEQQAKREAEDANRAKDEFLAMLSHELRTPLNSILGWAAILRAGKLPLDQASHALEIIERNAKTETQLVESLLDLSRIMAGKLKLDLAAVDLSAIVDGVVDSLRPVADTKEVLLESDVPQAPLVTVGDAGRLQQIFSNLISNALKFTSSGGHVRIQLSHRSRRAEIQVADDGEGISPEVLPAIFERFRQAESAAARPHGGLGLGLAIVRELVHAHRGTVVATSPGKGRGSTFTVTLPIPAVIPVNLEAPFSTPVNDEEPAISTLNVLVVDDDQDARELVAVTLKSQGAAVQMASSTIEAFQVIDQKMPDILIADIGMPQDDGYSLIRQLRALEIEQGRRHLPAIALTAYASASDRDQAIAAGYDLHLKKPVGPKELTNAVATT